jgi:hypothetical protein
MKKMAIIISLLICLSGIAASANAQTQGGPFALPVPVVITHPLAFESSGEQVVLLQQFLSNYGFFSYPSLTGYFGLITKASVTAFQSAYGIDPVGIVGPITRAKIISLTQKVEVVDRDTTIPTKKTSGRHRSSNRSVTVVDTDEDGISDDTDNCVADSNPSQLDTDDDGVGDSCDVCPEDADADQADDDDNGIGNECEAQGMFTLTVDDPGIGIVTSSPAGISCAETCSAAFASGTVITLTATAILDDAFFSGWSGGGCSGTGSCVITLVEDTVITPSFSIYVDPEQESN